MQVAARIVLTKETSNHMILLSRAIIGKIYISTWILGIFIYLIFLVISSHKQTLSLQLWHPYALYIAFSNLINPPSSSPNATNLPSRTQGQLIARPPMSSPSSVTTLPPCACKLKPGSSPETWLFSLFKELLQCLDLTGMHLPCSVGLSPSLPLASL